MVAINHLTDELLPPALVQKIVATIQRQCYGYTEYKQKLSGLIYEPYMNTRAQYSLTGMVLSGFAPDRFFMDGVRVNDLNYGLSNYQKCQPELITEKAVIQIYSSSAKPLKNKIVMERCKKLNSNKSTKRFLFVQFEVDKKDILTRITAVYPNENAVRIEKKELYIRSKVSVLAG